MRRIEVVEHGQCARGSNFERRAKVGSPAPNGGPVKVAVFPLDERSKRARPVCAVERIERGEAARGSDFVHRSKPLTTNRRGPVEVAVGPLNGWRVGARSLDEGETMQYRHGPAGCDLENSAKAEIAAVISSSVKIAVGTQRQSAIRIRPGAIEAVNYGVRARRRDLKNAAAAKVSA